MNKEKAYRISVAVFVAWIIALILVGQLIGGKEVWTTLTKLDTRTLGILLAGFLVNITLWAISWKLILLTVGENVKITDLVYSMFPGFFVDNITPTILVGGEITMAYMLKKKTNYRIKTEKSLATVMFQMLCWFMGTVAFGVFMIAGGILYLNLDLHYAIALGIPLVLLSGAFLVFFGLMYNESVVEKVVMWSARKLGWLIKKLNPDMKKPLEQKAMEWIRTFNETLRKIPHATSMLIMGGIIFTGLYMVETFVLYTLINTLGGSISLLVAGIVLIFSVLLTLVGMVPGGIGVFEISMASALSITGIKPEAVLVAIGVYRFVFFWITTIIGGLISVKEGLDTLGDEFENNVR